jgi:hypothetical protein
LYLLSQHWAVQMLPTVNFCISQPWFKGFNGEFPVDYAKFWVDQSVKGH